MGESIAKEEYVGACIDLTAGAVGYGIGLGIATVATGLIAAAVAPAAVIGVAAFIVGVGIDLGANAIKDWYYER